MIEVIATITTHLAAAACVGGSRRRYTDHIGAADQTGEGIVTAVGGRGSDHHTVIVEQCDGYAVECWFAAIDLVVVVVIFPNIVADAEFVEAKVQRLVAIGVDVGQVAAIAAFAAADGWFIADGQADRRAGDHTQSGEEVAIVILILVIIGIGCGTVAVAGDIGIQDVAIGKVGRCHDDQIGCVEINGWRQFGKGVVAAAAGSRCCDEAIAGIVNATAVAILVEFQLHCSHAGAAAGYIACTVIIQAIVVGVIPDAIAQVDKGPEAKVKAMVILTRGAGRHVSNGKVAGTHAIGVDTIGQCGATVHIGGG